MWCHFISKIGISEIHPLDPLFVCRYGALRCLGSCLPPQTYIPSLIAFAFTLVTLKKSCRTHVKYYEMHGIEAAQSSVISIPPVAHYRCVVTCSSKIGPTILGGFHPIYQMVSGNIQPAPEFYGTCSSGV